MLQIWADARKVPDFGVFQILEFQISDAQQVVYANNPHNVKSETHLVPSTSDKFTQRNKEWSAVIRGPPRASQRGQHLS
jgi:hypothetical protein